MNYLHKLSTLPNEYHDLAVKLHEEKFLDWDSATNAVLIQLRKDNPELYQQTKQIMNTK